MVDIPNPLNIPGDVADKAASTVASGLTSALQSLMQPVFELILSWMNTAFYAGLAITGFAMMVWAVHSLTGVGDGLGKAAYGAAKTAAKDGAMAAAA